VIPGYKITGEGWAMIEETGDRTARRNIILMDGWKRRIGFLFRRPPQLKIYRIPQGNPGFPFAFFYFILSLKISHSFYIRSPPI
jgi:hypothetical protein